MNKEVASSSSRQEEYGSDKNKEDKGALRQQTGRSSRKEKVIRIRKARVRTQQVQESCIEEKQQRQSKSKSKEGAEASK